jgi:hypothetical protein
MAHNAAVSDTQTLGAAAIDAERIMSVAQMVGELARCEVGGLAHAEFLDAHAAVAQLGKLADALRARFAGDLARRSTADLPGGGLARSQGFGNVKEMVARTTGSSYAGAARSIEAGLALTPEPSLVAPGERQPAAATPRYPAVAQATLDGNLSVECAGLIVAGLQTLGDSLSSEQVHALERRLVDKASRLSAHEVRRLVAQAVARADVKRHEAREERQHAERYLTWAEDQSGMVTFSGKLDPVTAAPIRTVIEQVVTQNLRRRRSQDPLEKDQRTIGQMRADALFEVCRHAIGCTDTDTSSVRTTVVVRIDKKQLDEGVGLGTIDGVTQPVSVGQLRRLAGDAEIVPEVLSHDSEVLDLGRRVRMFTRAQRLALLERDGGCAKCHAPPEHCEAHHIRWWERGGRSDLNNGVMLCTRCHHDVHRQGWGITVHGGRVSFIPPPDIDPAQIPRLGGAAALTLDDEPELQAA